MSSVIYVYTKCCHIYLGRLCDCKPYYILTKTIFDQYHVYGNDIRTHEHKYAHTTVLYNLSLTFN